VRIVAKYSFNQGEKEVTGRYPELLAEIKSVIGAIDTVSHLTKQSKEKTKKFKLLYNPVTLNKAFKSEFGQRGWKAKKEFCDYSTAFYVSDYKPERLKGQKPYREMDFVKGKLGVEVQFGKYAFMVYNVCAKMTIFRNLGHIDCGVEIVPVRGFTKTMSTGVAYFEQFTWDLEKRGVGDIDIPVLVLGIDANVLVSEKGDESEIMQLFDVKKAI
jgi:hypothetical protein